jgi:hypothetical protein
MPAKKWKDFEGDDTYVKFGQFGDFVEGVITKIAFEVKFGKEQPVLTLLCNAIDEETGKAYTKERTLTVGQKNLQRQLAMDPPEEGDGILITYVSDAPGSPNPTKIFEVKITPKAMVGKDTPAEKSEQPLPNDDPF